MRLWIKRALLGICVSVSLLIGSIVAILFMPMGLKFVIWGLGGLVPQLLIESSEGSLMRGFTLKGVSYASPLFSLTGKTLSLELDPHCFLKSALCVRSFDADGVDIRAALSPDASDKPSSNPVVKVSSPLPLFLKKISLSHISLDISGHKIHWDSFTSGLEFQENNLTIKPTFLDGIEIALAHAKKEVPITPPVVKNKPFRLELALPEVVIPMNVVIEEFDIKNAKLALPEKQNIAHLLLKGKAYESKIILETLLLDAEQAKLKGKGVVQLKGAYPLVLNAEAEMKLSPLKGHTVSLMAKGPLDDLQLDTKIKGTLKAELQGEINLMDPLLPFSVLFTSSNLQWPLESPEKYRLNATSLKVKGNLDVYRARLSTNFVGEGLPKSTLNTSLNGDLSHISLTDVHLGTLDGDIKGLGSVHWGEGVKWKSKLILEKIKPGTHWKELKDSILSGQFETEGRVNEEGGWFVSVPSVSLSGALREKSFSLLGDVKARDIKGQGRIRAETKLISLRHGTNIVELKGKVGEQLDLDLFVELPHLENISPDLKGNLKGKMDIWGSLESPMASLNFSGGSFAWQKTASIKNLNLRGTLKSTPLMGGGLVLKVSDIKVPGADISELAVRLSGDTKKHAFSLSVKGEPVDGDIKLRGRTLKDENWQGEIHKATLKTPVGLWRLLNDAKLAFNAKTNQLDIGAFCWVQGKSRLCLDKPVKLADKGRAEISLSKFKLSQLKPLLPKSLALKGYFNANTKLAWKPNALPEIDGNISMDNGFVELKNEKPFILAWNDILFKMKLAHETLKLKMDIDLKNNGGLALEAEMSNLSEPKRPLRSHLNIHDLNLNMFSSLVGPDATVKGILNTRIAVENTVQEGVIDLPKATGRISLSKIKLQSLLSPVEVQKGDVSFVMKGTQGTLKGKINTKEGALNLSGFVRWKELDKILASLSLKGKEIKVQVPPMVALKVSPDLRMELTQKEVNVTGKVLVPWGRVIVESLPVSAVKVSSDLVILNDQFEPVKKKAKDAFTVNAKIGVTLGDDVLLDAFGLKTALVGGVIVSSDNLGPKVAGEVNLEKGTYRSFGQDLLIRKGQIIFNGPPEQPYFQIEAVRNPDAIEGNVEAGIRLSGPADAPEMQIFSKPAMPQANALSYLTRGRNLDSTSEGNVMTSMLIGLGLSQSEKLFGQIGSAVGVDDFSVDTSGTGNDEKVEVSGYILPGLQVKYGVGIFTRLPEFKVRYRLIKDLYVEAVSGTDNAVDLLYQFTVE